MPTHDFLNGHQDPITVKTAKKNVRFTFATDPQEHQTATKSPEAHAMPKPILKHTSGIQLDPPQAIQNQPAAPEPTPKSKPQASGLGQATILTQLQAGLFQQKAEVPALIQRESKRDRAGRISTTRFKEREEDGRETSVLFEGNWDEQLPSYEDLDKIQEKIINKLYNDQGDENRTYRVKSAFIKEGVLHCDYEGIGRKIFHLEINVKPQLSRDVKPTPVPKKKSSFFTDLVTKASDDELRKAGLGFAILDDNIRIDLSILDDMPDYSFTP